MRIFNNLPKLSSEDTANSVVTYDSMDSADANSWTDVDVIASGEKHHSLFKKISTMFKNIRYIFKKLGTTDISAIGDGTVTGGLSKINNDLNVFCPRFSWHSLEKLETTLDLPISHNYGAVIFAYWRGNAGHNGTPIICFTIRRSNDGSVAVVNNLDGSESTVTATCNDNGVTVDLTSLSVWGYMRVLVLHLV